MNSEEADEGSPLGNIPGLASSRGGVERPPELRGAPVGRVLRGGRALDGCLRKIIVQEIRTGITRPGKRFEHEGLTGEIASFNRRRRRRSAPASNCSGVGGPWTGDRGLGGAGLRGVPRGQFIVAEGASTGRSRELNVAINGCLCMYVS